METFVQLWLSSAQIPKQPGWSIHLNSASDRDLGEKSLCLNEQSSEARFRATWKPLFAGRINLESNLVFPDNTHV